MKKLKGGFESLLVYSTHPNEVAAEQASSDAALPASAQQLIVRLETKHRGGKMVTVVDGFKGTVTALEALGKTLKTKCGTGGSAKDGQIIVQGDFRDKITDLLIKEGFKAKRGN